MKKILLICSFLALTVSQVTHAQDLTGSSYGNTIDTVVNSGTYYLTTPALYTVADHGYTIQLDCTNKTGTSTITAVLQSSNNNLTWSNHFKVPGQSGVNCDTLAISGTTQHIYNILIGNASTYNGVINYTNSGRRVYFRIKLVGGATQTTQIKAKAYIQ